MFRDCRFCTHVILLHYIYTPTTHGGTLTKWWHYLFPLQSLLLLLLEVFLPLQTLLLRLLSGFSLGLLFLKGTARNPTTILMPAEWWKKTHTHIKKGFAKITCLLRNRGVVVLCGSAIVYNHKKILFVNTGVKRFYFWHSWLQVQTKDNMLHICLRAFFLPNQKS